MINEILTQKQRKLNLISKMNGILEYSSSHLYDSKSYDELLAEIETLDWKNILRDEPEKYTLEEIKHARIALLNMYFDSMLPFLTDNELKEQTYI